MKKKTLTYSIWIAVLVCLMQVTPAFASPPASQITEGKFAPTQERMNNLETTIQQLDNSIVIAMEKSKELNDDINHQQAQIEKTNAEIAKGKQELEARKQVYSNRLRSIQEQGQTPIIAYAELLFSSKDITEFLNRSTAISQILQSDSDILNGLKEKEQELNDLEQRLHNELDNLQKSKAEFVSKQNKIQADKQAIEQELEDSKGQLAQEQAAAQIQQPEKPLTNANLSTSFSDNANKVIAFAEQLLGVPYVWGGTTPSGFDCSGFMQYVFHSVGVDLPRISQEQQNTGIRIPANQVEPGDLVFMGYPAYHVGMYIGNGQWIHAPETGDVIKIASYNPAHFTSAARVLR